MTFFWARKLAHTFIHAYKSCSNEESITTTLEMAHQPGVLTPLFGIPAGVIDVDGRSVLLREFIFLLKNCCHRCGSWTSRRTCFLKFLVHQEHAMNWIFLATTVALSLIGILYSHKIAGLLYNLQKFIQEHTFQKRIDRPLKFRERDFFPELTETVCARHSKSKFLSIDTKL